MKKILDEFRSKNIYGKLFILTLFIGAVLIGYFSGSVKQAFLVFTVYLLLWNVVGVLINDKLYKK